MPMSEPRPEAPTLPDPAVSILVISYNTREMTLACLASIAAETTVPHEVIVLDNASPDGSAAAIAAAFPEIRLIASPENHGFAKGNNLAAPWHVASIPAAEPRHGGAGAGYRPADLLRDRTPQAGIWGGRTLKATEASTRCALSPTTLSGACSAAPPGLRCLPKSALFNPESTAAGTHSEREVDVVQGSFFLIRRALWERWADSTSPSRCTARRPISAAARAPAAPGRA